MAKKFDELLKSFLADLDHEMARLKDTNECCCNKPPKDEAEIARMKEEAQREFEKYEEYKRQMLKQEEESNQDIPEETESESDIEVVIPCEGDTSKVEGRYDKQTKVMTVHIQSQRTQDHGILVDTDAEVEIDFTKANIDPSTLKLDYDELGMIVISADCKQDDSEDNLKLEIV